jgi:hypothetical protein
MKRDMDLIRDILTKIEERTETHMNDLMPDPDNAEDRARYGYHIKMLVDAGFLEAIDGSSMESPDWYNLEVRWYGHEFLSTVSDPTVWEKTKEVTRKAGGGGLQVMLEIGKTIIVETAKEQLKKIGLG